MCCSYRNRDAAPCRRGRADRIAAAHRLADADREWIRHGGKMRCERARFHARKDLPHGGIVGPGFSKHELFDVIYVFIDQGAGAHGVPVENGLRNLPVQFEHIRYLSLARRARLELHVISE